MGTTIDISKLTVEERLQLMDEIWDSLSGTQEVFPLTAAQAEELDRRAEEMDRDGSLGRPWEEVMREIRAQRR